MCLLTGAGKRNKSKKAIEVAKAARAKVTVFILSCDEEIHKIKFPVGTLMSLLC